MINVQEPEGGFKEASYAAFRRFVQRGLRARLASGSLLTGQKLVALDFIADAKPATMIESGPVPELPTISGASLDGVLDSTKALLVSAKSAIDGLDQQLRSPEIKRSLASLDRSLANIDAMTRDASTQFGPLLGEVRAASRAADAALQQVTKTLAVANTALSSDPAEGGDLAGMLRELRDAAASLHQLSDFLEKHPDSLISGRTGKSK
jgi:paraquat-inducible protein B